MGVIQSYMFDGDATEYASLPDRVGAMRQHIHDKLFPGLTPDEVAATAEKVWQDDPWVEGGWAWTGREEMRGPFQAKGGPRGACTSRASFALDRLDDHRDRVGRARRR
jgi:monoamine oxidase